LRAKASKSEQKQAKARQYSEFASKSTSIQRICEQKQAKASKSKQKRAKASKSEQKRAKAKSYKRSDCLYFFLSKIQTNVMDKQQIKEIAKIIHARRVRLTAATYPMIEIWLDPAHTDEPAARLLRAMVENDFRLSDAAVDEICRDNTFDVTDNRWRDIFKKCDGGYLIPFHITELIDAARQVEE
jgi:folylpolyglutamate synthase/dihydropteroate synthase